MPRKTKPKFDKNKCRTFQLVSKTTFNDDEAKAYLAPILKGTKKLKGPEPTPQEMYQPIGNLKPEEIFGCDADGNAVEDFTESDYEDDYESEPEDDCEMPK